MRLRFFLLEALRSIRANVAISVAATVTVLIAVFILGAFIPSFLYVQSTVDAQKQKVDVHVYISDSATAAQVESLRKRLRANPHVRTLQYVSKDDALKLVRERLSDPSVLRELPGNPLPARFNVKLDDPANGEAVVDQITGHPAIHPTEGIYFPKESADKLLSVARFIQWAGLVLISILLVASVLLIGNTIRLSIFARRREVEVMKLVGATNWFIRWPFVIEGIVCGVVGAILSVLLLWAIKVGVVDGWLESSNTALTRDEATTIGFVWLCFILIAAGGIVGAIGSGITLRRFLRV